MAPFGSHGRRADDGTTQLMRAFRVHYILSLRETGAPVIKCTFITGQECRKVKGQKRKNN